MKQTIQTTRRLRLILADTFGILAEGGSVKETITTALTNHQLFSLLNNKLALYQFEVGEISKNSNSWVPPGPITIHHDFVPAYNETTTDPEKGNVTIFHEAVQEWDEFVPAIDEKVKIYFNQKFLLADAAIQELIQKQRNKFKK